MDLKFVESKIKEKLKTIGYELYSIRNYNSKNGPTLEVVVDRDNSINLDDIVYVSLELSILLDEIDSSNNPYILDVSSLGAEKPIDVKNISKYISKYINIHLANPYKGMNSLEGTLEEVDGEFIIISFKEKTRTIKAKINVKDIDKARLAIKF